MVNENASLIKYEPPKCDECGRKIVVLSDLCAKCAAGIELNGKEQVNPLPTWPKPSAPPNPPPAPAVAVNEVVLEENDAVIISRKVVELIADRLSVNLFDDPNGPMFLVCDGCGGSVGTGYRNGKPIADESDIKHDPYCPFIWVENFLNGEKKSNMTKQAIRAAEAAKGGV